MVIHNLEPGMKLNDRLLLMFGYATSLHRKSQNLRIKENFSTPRGHPVDRYPANRQPLYFLTGITLP